ncbi:MAG: hypothetical protein V2I48_16750 [Xanthomonadales bacterium]|jgi:hypothetical protein|nr:hypothetical protein [Xanthomonadales bacterium]
MRFPLISLLALLIFAPLPAAAEETVLFTVDVKLSGTGVSEVDLEVSCDLDRPFSLTLPIEVDSSRTFTVPAPADRDMACVLIVEPLPGQQLTFLGDGGSTFDPDGQGCRFTGIRRGHSNFCQVQVESQETSLTVFKHWIGTSKKEDNVSVFLDCGQGMTYETLEINSRRPASWSLQVNDADGFHCSVSEEESEAWIADPGDCRDLLILPGAEEECTMVNTKVVKMIEMFNRYGLVIMILAFMAVGGLAARKMIP